MKKSSKQHLNLSTFLLGLICWLTITAAHAAGPLWTIVPALGSNPVQVVAEDDTATVQYIVQNQSAKSKKLIMQPIQGIAQTSDCVLAPRGQTGSSCTLNLAITGSDLPRTGVQGGPVLCLANADGSPNPNQCYQPSAANSLRITTSTTPGQASLSVSGSPLLLFAGFSSVNSVSKSLTITNTSTEVTAKQVMATLPVSWSDVTQDASGCQTLAPGASCQLVFTAGTNEHDTSPISIAGTNTPPVSADLSIMFPWVVGNGQVQSMALDSTNNLIYIGGTFNYVGANTGTGATIDGTTSQLIRGFPRVKGEIRVSLPDGNGGWYIAGDFTQVGSVLLNRVAHILPDNSVDANFNPDVNAIVYCLALNGGTLYMGGGFTSVGGQTRNYIAAVDATTGALTAWNPNADHEVEAMVIDGSLLYAGGLFTNIGGQSRSFIAALNIGSGSATSWDPGAGGVGSIGIFSLAINGNTLYVGGLFSTLGGLTRNNIGALDTGSNTATSWDPNSNSLVSTFAVGSGVVYAGGNFTNIGGLTRNRIAALDASSGAATSWDPNSSALVNFLALNGGTLYVGGSFTTIGGQARNRVAALDTTTGLATSWNPNASGSVYYIGINGNTFYVAGTFNSIGGMTRNRIAALSTTTGVATAWDPNTTGTSVLALAVDGSTVYAGGTFTNIGGANRNNLAALEASSGNATTWNPNVNNTVNALAIDNGLLYAGGVFSTIGGVTTRNRLASFDSLGALTGWNPNAAGGNVSALFIDGSTAYVGGTFTSVGGQARNRLAALDTTSGLADATWSPSPNAGNVTAILVHSSTVYVGGTTFTTIGGGQPRTRIAALNPVPTSGSATSWSPNATNTVSALAFNGTSIYAGGVFTTIGGQARNRVAALALTTGAPTSWDPNANNSINALIINNGTAYLGGNFTALGGDSVSGFAIISP